MAGWPVETVWTFRRGENLLEMLVIEPRVFRCQVGNTANVPTDSAGNRLMRVLLYKDFPLEFVT